MDEESAITLQKSPGEYPAHLKESANYLGVSVQDLLNISVRKRSHVPTSMGLSIDSQRYGTDNSTSTSGEESYMGPGDLLAGITPPYSEDLNLNFPDCVELALAECSTDDVGLTDERLEFEPNASLLLSGEAPTLLNRSQLSSHSCDEDFSTLLRGYLESRPDSPRDSSGHISDEYEWIQFPQVLSGESVENSSEDSTESTSNDPALARLSPPNMPLLTRERSPVSSRLQHDLDEDAPRQHRALLPKPPGYGLVRSRLSSQAQQSVKSFPETSESRIRKKRRPYNDRKTRLETHMTRRINACIRCRMQRNRVTYPMLVSLSSLSDLSATLIQIIHVGLACHASKKQRG